MLRSSFREHGFFSHISTQFWELLLKQLLNCHNVIAIGAVDIINNKIAGYIIATTNFTETKIKILNFYFIFNSLWYILLMLIKKPSKLYQLIYGIALNRHRGRTIPEQRWITWVVHSSYQNQGVGKALYNNLCARMKNSGVKSFYGSVDCSNKISNEAHMRL